MAVCAGFLGGEDNQALPAPPYPPPFQQLRLNCINALHAKMPDLAQRQ